MNSRAVGLTLVVLGVVWSSALAQTAVPPGKSPSASTASEGKKSAPAADTPAEVQRRKEAAEKRRTELEAKRQITAKLDAAVSAIVTEAKVLGEVQEEKNKPHWSRPHPALKALGPDAALPMLYRMGKDFTSNDYCDTYVRWHLMATVKLATQDDREEAGKQLVTLIRQLPNELTVQEKREWYDEPPAISAEWHKKYYSLRRRVGYPPFEKLVDPPDSLNYMTPLEKIEAEKTWAEAQDLRTKWTRTVDKAATAFNYRVRQVRHILREYRGELIYELIKTGDPAMLDLVIREIGRQADAKTGNAYDLLNYLYLAAYDGFLNLYPKEVLQRSAAGLEKIGRGHDQYVEFGRLQRNFADYCFHMVHMLRDSEGFLDLRDKKAAVRPAAKYLGAQKFSADTLTIDQIHNAITRAIDALYDAEKNEKLQPTYTPIPHYVYTLPGHRLHVPQEVRNMFGNQALICWALLACGESYQNPPLYKRINWVLSSDTPQTFDRGMRVQMLAELPRLRWKDWVYRDAIWLGGALGNKGNFTEEWFGQSITDYGDNANGQYGVLGIWGCERNGYNISAKIWANIDQYWRNAQQKTREDEPAGWSVFSFEQKESKETSGMNFYRRVSGPMTAGGVATLCLTERYLRGPRMLVPGEQHVSPELRKGLRWLDENFSLDDKAEETDRFYYYWTMQRVGNATGFKSFHGVDLFRDITARMLNEQTPEGTWNGDKGPLLSTGFALLYLARAYDPLAMGKVRYQVRDAGGKISPGYWNNRPHDVWNFVDYISDQYECATSWQIVELNLGVSSLMETPLLYLATDRGFELSDKEIRSLRDYINAGGTLLLNPDKIGPDVSSSFRKLGEQLFPDHKWKPVPRDHSYYTIHQTLRAPIPMQMLSNGIRPLVVQFLKDIGEDLQTNNVASADSFRMLSNIYLHATGLNPKRTRLVNHHVPLPLTKPTRQINAARIQHSGQFDPEPAALSQLANVLADSRWSLNLDVARVSGKQLSQQSIAFLTTLGDGELSDEDAASIRQWLEKGHVLWIDAAGGSAAAAKNAEALLRKIVPDAVLAPLSSENPLISGEGLRQGRDVRWARYRNFALRTMGPLNRPKLQGVEINGRTAILFSTEDITCGLAGLDQWDIFGYTPQTARDLAVNSVLVAGNIK
ncbi:MAG: DUF4159 domain-containing protein [Phycisphaeraceae bacterium]|nr:DUF4159 domain-containing protein [Phycisphaeraceae bacterium]